MEISVSQVPWCCDTHFLSPMLAIPRIVPTCACAPQCGRHFGSDAETTGGKGIGDTKGDRIKRTPKNGNGGDMVRNAVMRLFSSLFTLVRLSSSTHCSFILFHFVLFA